MDELVRLTIVANEPEAELACREYGEDELFALFDDLEDQASALHAADRMAEVADRSRAEYQQVTLASRLMASIGTSATLGVRGVGQVTGMVERVANGWLLLSAGEQDWVINTDAVATVEGASVRSVPEVAWSPLTRLGLASALRRISEGALTRRRSMTPKRKAAWGGSAGPPRLSSMTT